MIQGGGDACDSGSGECGGATAATEALGDEHAADGCGEVERAGDHPSDTEVHHRPGRHDGRAKLPLAHGLWDCARGGVASDLGVEPLGTDGERWRDDVINPWLSNGRNNFRTVAEIANSALAPGMTDAEKGLRPWFQEIHIATIPAATTAN